MIKVNKTTISFSNGRGFTRIKVGKSYIVEIAGSTQRWLITPTGFQIREVGVRKYQGGIYCMSSPFPSLEPIHLTYVLASDILSIREARPSEM